MAKALSAIALLICLATPSNADTRFDGIGFGKDSCGTITSLDHSSMRVSIRSWGAGFLSGLNMPDDREPRDLSSLDWDNMPSRAVQFCRDNPSKSLMHMMLDIWFELPLYEEGRR